MMVYLYRSSFTDGGFKYIDNILHMYDYSGQYLKPYIYESYITDVHSSVKLAKFGLFETDSILDDVEEYGLDHNDDSDPIIWIRIANY